MKSDIDIARSTPLLPIGKIAEKVSIDDNELRQYGKYMAKVPCTLIDESKLDRNNLILVTAITPTKAGIGKTTTSIGLALGLNRIGKNAVVALREPSLGPCFGMKGGAAGGGYAQVLPMDDINLHFTGDFHAITSAHNMITALLDNYLFRMQGTDNYLKEVLWKRVLDVNDRSLRNIVTGLHGSENGVATESGFEITPASEIMAILCLASDADNLKYRIENIILGYFANGKPFTVKDLGVAGSIAVLLKDAIHPNLTQTTENTPAFVHGGPFANIAHGCNSIIATKMAMSHSDYTITEAGFGADLGAEKFFNIKCRKAAICPKLTVLVVTTQALKMHGNVPIADIKKENAEGLQRGFENMERHIQNMKRFGQTVVVALNKYHFDTESEIMLIKEHCAKLEVYFAINESFAKGGEGAIELANIVVEAIEKTPSKPLQFSYDDSDSIESKLHKVATSIYGAKEIILSAKAKKKMLMIAQLGYSHYPICIAKTQYSFSDSAHAYGVPKGFTIEINDLILNNGAEFVVAIAGNIMRMPGLPENPQANYIDLVNGHVEGLS